MGPPGRPDYEAVVADGVTGTTVEAEAAQDDAVVEIAPTDADEDADGHQLAADGRPEIPVTVTSPDGSREKVYRVRLVEAGPSASCLRGAIAVGFGLVVYEGAAENPTLATGVNQGEPPPAAHARHRSESREIAGI